MVAEGVGSLHYCRTDENICKVLESRINAAFRQVKRKQDRICSSGETRLIKIPFLHDAKLWTLLFRGWY